MANGNKSLGTLYLATKTKDRSPDMKGTITIKKSHLQALGNQMSEEDTDEVVANIAAWSNSDGSKRRFLTIELQPSTSYPNAKGSNGQPRNIFDFISEQNS
jgi:hypothetical protein